MKSIDLRVRWYKDRTASKQFHSQIGQIDLTK